VWQEKFWKDKQEYQRKIEISINVARWIATSSDSGYSEVY
jgi:hypothetical protein